MQKLRRHLSVLAFTLAWLFASQAVAVGLAQGRLGSFSAFSDADATILCSPSAVGQPSEAGAPSDEHSDHHEHCLAMGMCGSLTQPAKPPTGTILPAPHRSSRQATMIDIAVPEIPPPFREGKPRGPPAIV